MCAGVYFMTETERCVCENIMTVPSSTVGGCIASECVSVIYENVVCDGAATVNHA